MRAVLRRAAILMTTVAGAGVLAAGMVVAAAGPAAALPSNCAQNPDMTTVTCTYGFTGAAQTFTVPAGVTSITVDAYGAQGGDGGVAVAGLGGEAKAALSVSPGDLIEVLVGGQGGGVTGSAAGAAGFNGGGAGGAPGTSTISSGAHGGGGGGASDVRTGTCAATLPAPSCGLGARVLVAGGAGGSVLLPPGRGGAGSNPSGGTGESSGLRDSAGGGGGGSQTGGGTPGARDLACSDTTAGSAGGSPTQDAGGTGGGGGSIANDKGGDGGGGGGGGYYGGGGGGGSCSDSLESSGAGGGGSSFGPSGTLFTTGARSGDGQVTITYTGTAAATTTTVSAPAGSAVGTAIAPTNISATLSGQTSGAGGTITFTVFGPQSSPPTDCTSGGTTVGTAAVSGAATTYNPSAGFTPGSTGTYWWYASYGGDDQNVVSNSGCGTGMTSTVVSVPQNTTTTASDATTAFSASSQNVTLSATVTAASTVNEGAVTFTVFDSSSNAVGTATPGAVTNGSAAVSYALPAGLAPGTYTIDASYTDTAGSFTDSSDNTATLTVSKATPQITWANPADITWGTPLSGTQLDATASVPGAFVYTPAAGTVLGPGNGQALSVSFTPTDTTDYTTASESVAVNVVFSPATCITGRFTGPLVIGSGQAYCVGKGATVTNGVTVKPGGALYLTGGTIKGSLTASKAAAITVCGATVSGGVTITGATGPVAIGGCGNNTIAGSVSLTNNSGGVTYQNNTVSGSLTITGNSGGTVTTPGNKTAGKVTIKNNT